MRSHALPSERMGESAKLLIERTPLREAARRGNLEPSSPSADPFPFAAPDARRKAYISAPRAGGCGYEISKRIIAGGADRCASRAAHRCHPHGPVGSQTILLWRRPAAQAFLAWS